MTRKAGRSVYLDQARARARRRKSRWNLLLIPFCTFGISLCWYLVAKVMAGIYEIRHPGSTFGHTRTTLGGDLLYVPLVFPAIPLGLMIGNILIWCILPARRALDLEAKGVWHASFKESMRDLALFALVITPIPLILSFIGALGPF